MSGKYQCLGGPLDGTNPLWADGREKFYVPVPVDLPVRRPLGEPFDFAFPEDFRLEKDTYYLVRLKNGRTVYLWQDSFHRLADGGHRGEH